MECKVLVSVEVTQSRKKLKYPQVYHLNLHTRKLVCTVHILNEKDAMTSRCLDRKEV